jgi:Kef-type K+ transport system membrane component KefB
MQAFLEVSLILALATGMAILMQSLRLPLLLGHILTGILVGPAVWHILQAKETVEIFSQLGITALLFVVGLGLHPQVIREVGKIALLTGIGQVVFTTGFGFILALLFGFSWISALCIAIALTFSSTIIVTKILSDRGDSGKLYGKISIGFLLVQDVIATLILILVGSIGGAQDVRSLVVVVGIKLLIVAATMLVTAQFILPRLTRLFAASQEFLFLFSIGWGVGLAAIFYAIGLSVEIGALAAGVTLASSPYRYEINAKMRLVRDFFIVMFFVLLGSRLSWEGLGAQWPVILLFSFFVLIGNPIIIMGILRVCKNRIDLIKESYIGLRLMVKYFCNNRSRKFRKLFHISLAKIKKVARWCMTVVKYLYILSHISESIETIPREDDDIILREELRLREKSVSECEMADTFCENRLPKWDHLACESEFSGIKTSFRKKSRDEICIEGFCHERHESLPSSAVEEGIMEDGDFLFHKKRILNNDEKTIEFHNETFTH